MKRYRLDEVTKIYSGATPLTKNKTFYEGGNISWITPKDLSGYKHKYIFKGNRSITQEGYDSCATKLLPKGAVLFSSRAPIGYAAIAGQELCTNQGFKSFVCNEELLLNQYLYYYLIQNRDKFEAIGNGSTFKEISLKTISKYEINLPSVDEQKKMIQDLVILDKKYDENCLILSNVKMLLEHLYCRYFEDNERHYSRVHLCEVVEIVTGGTPSTKNKNYWHNGIYHWYTPTDITNCECMISFYAEKKISVSGLMNSGAKLIPAKSVIMTSRATVGEATINAHDSTTNQGILSLVPKEKGISVLQLYFWVKRNRKLISSAANGSTFKEIYKKDLEKLTININKKIEGTFLRESESLFAYYESLEKENIIILDLKRKLLEANF